MKKNTLYLLEMGMHDNNILTDIKNHRIRVVENIDILYKGKEYNMFFEFTQGTHRRYRTTNKRTGAPLKKAVEEIILKDGLYIDTEYERTETDERGFTWKSSWRNSALEREFYEEFGIEPEIRIMGPIIGTHVGPDAVAFTFVSNEEGKY